ncbi:MAG: TonB-dependent receptor [Cellvibrio sp.]
MKKFAIKPLAVAMAFAAVPMVGHAQDSGAGLVEEVIVTGSYRDSLQNSLNIKKNEAGAVDAIVADDIASFPDNNLAESLQRIPGVAITRVAGEGRQISVRGLSGEFTRTRINGMEAVATGGGTDAAGGMNKGRSFDFNTFSSELFSSLTVRKTAAAKVDEGSLGAVVDMKAAQPFDFDGFTFAASGTLGYNDKSEETDPKASLLISNTFADDTFGVLFSLAYSERNLEDNGASTVRWNNVNDIAGADDAFNDGFRPRLPRYDAYTHEMDRLGSSLSLQWKPTDVTTISLDGLYAKFDANRNERFMQTVLNDNSLTGAMTVNSYTVDEHNTVIAADFSGATVRSENRYDEMSTEFTQITLTGEHEFTDSFRGNFLIGTSESEFDNSVQTTLIAQKQGIDFSYDYSGANRTDPVLTWGAEIEDLNGWATNSVRMRPMVTNNKFDSVQFNFTNDLADGLSVEYGLSYKNFEFDTIGYRLRSEGANGKTIGMMPYDSGLGTNGNWAIPDHSSVDLSDLQVSARAADTNSVKEESAGAYVQLNFDTTLGETPVRGDIGLRYVETDVTAKAWPSSVTWIEDATVDIAVGTHSYDNLLPSVNLVFEPIEDVLIRASYSEVMARAGLGSLAPNVNVSVSGGARSVSSGNPALEPTKAAAYDLGVELYITPETMMGFAIFYKDIESYVQSVRETRPFTTTGINPQFAIAACEASSNGYGAACNENLDWEISSPINAPGGDLYGFEVSFQTPFTALPGFWSNFGIMTNFTYVQAEQDFLNSSGAVVATRSLLGLSKDTSSATLYYETDDFSARVSAVHRSDYLTHATGRDNNDREGTNSTTNIDAVISYNINDNWKVSFEALNLTDEADDQWVDYNGNRLSYYHETGRQFYLGAQYKF